MITHEDAGDVHSARAAIDRAHSLRSEVHRQQLQRAFIERGLAVRDEARATGDYIDAVVVHAELRDLLEDARAPIRQPREDDYR